MNKKGSLIFKIFSNNLLNTIFLVFLPSKNVLLNFIKKLFYMKLIKKLLALILITIFSGGILISCSGSKNSCEGLIPDYKKKSNIRKVSKSRKNLARHSTPVRKKYIIKYRRKNILGHK